LLSPTATLVPPTPVPPVPPTPVPPTPMSEPQPPTSIPNESTVARIFANGYFRGAIRKDLAQLSFIDENGRPAGFEADILREIARRWFENENAFYEHAVIIERADERKEVITSDEADMVASAFSYTEEREKVLDFSLIYFEDGQKLLVRITDEPPIENICDLNGRSVGVISATTGINNIITKVVENICGFTIEKQLVRYATHREAVSGLQNGGVAAVTTDGVILSGFENDVLKVVGLAFSEEQYGIGLPNNDAELKKWVDLTLQAMKFDRTYDAIFCQWFPDRPIYPYEAINPDGLDPETRQRVTTDLEPLYTLPQDYNGKECHPSPSDTELGIPPDTPRTYTVRTGDTLIGIALCHYGKISFWKDIFDANEEYIANSDGTHDLILPGWELRIPPVSYIYNCLR
jgi:polar amino acid transport system substrate-binding protein